MKGEYRRGGMNRTVLRYHPQGKPVPLIDGVAISLAQGWSARRLSLSAPALFVREVA